MNTYYKFISNQLLILIFISNATGIVAQFTALPWHVYLAPSLDLTSIKSISSHANVSVSDGSKFETITFFQDKQRVIFKQIYPDQSPTFGIDGKYNWTHNGNKEMKISDFHKDFIMGHQMHAQLLFFDSIQDTLTAAKKDEFLGNECLSISSQKEGSTFKIYYNSTNTPIGMVILIEGNPPISMELSEWKMTNGLFLPFQINISDGSRTFLYNYTSIEINKGTLNDYRLPIDLLNDEQTIMRIHRMIMDDHLAGNTDHIIGFSGDTNTIVSNGVVHQMGKSAFSKKFESIFSSRIYTVYDDLILPQIKISEDGTLAWLIAQVYAEGFYLDQNNNPSKPFDFTCAWIELYEKVEGEWHLIGNVSNFK